MKLVTVAQMRELERIAMEEYHIPSLLLMEHAAAGFVSVLEAEKGSLSEKRIHVFCGQGNNGGDGFAIARMLKNKGADVSITLLCEEDRVKGDANVNLTIARSMEIPFVSAEVCTSCDMIIDAIFGTGFHGETKGEAKRAIDLMNASKAYIASVDIPSGVSADSGEASASSVMADLCVTFAAVKPGHLLFPGRGHLKKLIKTDISVPRSVINGFLSGYDIIDKSAAQFIPVRAANSHKGSFGKALAFVGSKGMSGAAVLSASAILKSGAGMATAAVPESVLPIVASQLTAVMTYALPCENGALTEDAASLLLEKLETQDVLLLGCGIGTSEAAKRAVHHLILHSTKPMVLDADGLNAISDCPDILKQAKAEIVLTPHIMEFSRISGCSVSEIKDSPMETARTFAKTYGVTLVLKDAVTVVAGKTGQIYVSAGSNSGMATAGSGDVLSGIITGLMAQGADPEKAAVAGVYIHLAAGDLARKKKGEYGMTAEDILSAVPEAFMEEIDISPQIKEW